MKKTFLLLSALSLLTVAGTAFAQGFVPLAPIPGLTDISPTSVVNSATLTSFFNNLYKYCIGLSGVLAVVMIIWGGLEYATQDIPSAKQNGKDKILQAVLGLVLVLSPVLVFSIINPQILNLSVGLEPITFTAGSATRAPYIQTQVTPGSTHAIYNGQVIGFVEGAYPSAQPNTWCYPLSSPQTNTDPAINNGQSYTAMVYCARSSDGCRLFMNGNSGTPFAAAAGSQCSLTPP